MSNYELGPAFIAVAAFETVAADALAGTTGCTDSDTSITLDDSSEFPDSGIVKIEDEYILYLNNATATGVLSNCVRGIFNTTAAAHAGAEDVTYYASGLGDTLGGVTLTISETSIDLKTDQEGETPVDTRITGTTVRAEMNLADISLDNIAFAVKQTATGTSPDRTLSIQANVGYSLQDNAYTVHFFPYIGTTIDTNDEHQYTIMSGGILADINLGFDASNQRAIKITVIGYPDSSDDILKLGPPL